MVVDGVVHRVEGTVAAEDLEEDREGAARDEDLCERLWNIGRRQGGQYSCFILSRWEAPKWSLIILTFAIMILSIQIHDRDYLKIGKAHFTSIADSKDSYHRTSGVEIGHH
jgi:hypothetical protein